MKPKLTEKQRSAARRKAGRRLELKHTHVLRELRKYYDRPKFHAQWGEKFNARRTEQIRSDMIEQYPQEYKEILKEEEANARTEL